MKKVLLLILSSIFGITISNAQPKPTKDSIINVVLKSINDFSDREAKRDSILHHPLGSNTEEDFLRRYTFADSIYSALNKLDKNTLSVEGQINLELLKYDVEEDVSLYKFKAYLNPILSDAGFHTGLASMGSQVLSSQKEFENYINRLKDIPRFMEENIALMRSGLQLGICQPRSILNGYENTYEQHIVTDIEKSVFWKPAAFISSPARR